MIYHFIPVEKWEEVSDQDYYRTQSLEKEGFIHCSEKNQITEVANFKFNTNQDLTLLCIDEEKVEPEIKYEGKEGNKFPHIYGELNLDAVKQTKKLPKSDGKFQLPEEMNL